jgi:hypothetical protein
MEHEMHNKHEAHERILIKMKLRRQPALSINMKNDHHEQREIHENV